MYYEATKGDMVALVLIENGRRHAVEWCSLEHDVVQSFNKNFVDMYAYNDLAEKPLLGGFKYTGRVFHTPDEYLTTIEEER